MAKITRQDHQVINLQFVVTLDRDAEKMLQEAAKLFGVKTSVPPDLDKPLPEFARIFSVHRHKDGEDLE